MEGKRQTSAAPTPIIAPERQQTLAESVRNLEDAATSILAAVDTLAPLGASDPSIRGRTWDLLLLAGRAVEEAWWLGEDDGVEAGL